MARLGMVVEIDRCTGCYACFLACKDEFVGNDFPPLSTAQPSDGPGWIPIAERERGVFPTVKVSYIPFPCLHCAEAPCMAAAADGAVYRRPDGIVVIDPSKAVGQGEILSACPHQAVSWNREANVAQKCTFCAHLLDAGWKQPRCVEACPVDALIFGDLDDPSSAVAQARAAGGDEQPNPEYGLDPAVTFRGLPKRFVAGEVVLDDRPDECAQGIAVSLSGEGATLRTLTDGFGDFEFDGLAPDARYALKIELQGYQAWSREVETDTDRALGTIVLAAAR